MTLLVAGVVVFVNATGDDNGGGASDGGGNEGGQPVNAAESQWRTEPKPDGGGAFVSAVDSGQVWVADEVVVLLTGSGVWGFDRDSGEELWKLAGPEGTDVLPCSASWDVNAQGVGAVLYPPADDQAEEPNCTVLAAVDTTTGEVMWRKDLTKPGDDGVGELGGAVNATVGDEVITASLEERFHRFSIEDGEELPLPEVSPSPCPGESPGMSNIGELVVLHHDCYADDEDGRDRITAFDADTLQTLWSSPVEPDLDLHPRASDPLAFSVEGYWPERDSWLRMYDDAGEVSGDIPEGSDSLDGPFVTDSLVTMLAQGSDPEQRLARGFDPQTGARLWETELPPQARLLGESGEEPVVIYHEEIADRLDDAHVAWLNPADGTLTDDIVLPRHSRCCTAFVQDVAWTDDTLYVVDSRTGDVRLEAVARR
ncbi:PQQ-binding-like beta-propeller repeat protein [Streptomyces sp. B6B3]|uniref:outer membrane protein assembly factor BamB family protein n=1 Tax=Streptomyces sp. B6B3 TaxID=3153570 RepID=UPI00325C3B1F